jgi:transcriptional regulator with XRE-family HTH domain
MTGAQFRQLRKRLNLTQAQLAHEMGVTPNAVALWERGERPIRESIARFVTLLAASRQKAVRQRRKP